MSSRFKQGVSIRGLGVEVFLAWVVAAEVFSEHEFDCIITSGLDGHHNRGSRHYIGHALDLRSKHIPTLAIKKKIESEVQDRLEPLGDFDFFLESVDTPNEHYHLQFKPKERA